MDSIILNSGAVMLVNPSSQLNENRNFVERSDFRLTSVRIIQHLTGALLLFIIINIGLVSWIIQSTQLLHDPFGKISIPNTVRVEGCLRADKTLQTDQIIASNNNVREPHLGPFLTITSNQSLILKDISNKTDSNSVHLSSHGIEFRVKNSLEFATNNTRGYQSFKVVNDQVNFEDSNLNSIQPDSGGLRIGESLKINHLYGSHNQNLRIESRTESIKIDSKNHIKIESSVGSIDIKSPSKVHLNTDKLTLNSPDIRIKHIRQARSSLNDITGQYSTVDEPIAYQLCICATNNRVFLAMPDTDCRANDKLCFL